MKFVVMQKHNYGLAMVLSSFSGVATIVLLFDLLAKLDCLTALCNEKQPISVSYLSSSRALSELKQLKMMPSGALK